MTITKRGERFRAVLKSGREYVGSKTFDTKREATAWLRREQALLAGGLDPRQGRVRVRVVLTEWLQVRRTTVARNTYQADADLARLMPASLLMMNIGVVGEREIARSYEALLADGLAEASVRRCRASLSALLVGRRASGSSARTPCWPRACRGRRPSSRRCARSGMTSWRPPGRCGGATTSSSPT